MDDEAKASRRGRGAGRPTKLTPEVQAKICQGLRAGNFRTVAAEWAGVPERVFRDWMHRGKDGKSKMHADFRRAVIEAEKAAEIRAVGLIMKAAENDPKHMEWWLSHRFPQRWADQERRRVRAELTGKGGGPIEVQGSVDVSRLTREQFQVLEDVLGSEVEDGEDNSEAEDSGGEA